MVQIFFVRHGQANSDAKDEISYDKLSSLGKYKPDGWDSTLRKMNLLLMLASVGPYFVRAILQIY